MKEFIIIFLLWTIPSINATFFKEFGLLDWEFYLWGFVCIFPYAVTLKVFKNYIKDLK